MANNSLFNRKTRYVSGGTTEVGAVGIEWWERSEIESDSDDTIYVVEKRFIGRLDNIASLFFNDPKLWWIIAQYNNILDPYSEIVEGLILHIPKKSRADNLLQGKTGGISSQREVETTILPIV